MIQHVTIDDATRGIQRTIRTRKFQLRHNATVVAYININPIFLLLAETLSAES